MANVHCAAATRNFLALENHSLDVPFWQDLVNGLEKPIIQQGYIKVPDTPGLGVTLNDDECKKHLKPGTGYFEPTPMWDDVESNIDRLFSSIHEASERARSLTGIALFFVWGCRPVCPVPGFPSHISNGRFDIAVFEARRGVGLARGASDIDFDVLAQRQPFRFGNPHLTVDRALGRYIVRTVHRRHLTVH
jgi:hypothetical protein